MLNLSISFFSLEGVTIELSKGRSLIILCFLGKFSTVLVDIGLERTLFKITCLTTNLLMYL